MRLDWEVFGSGVWVAIISHTASEAFNQLVMTLFNNGFPLSFLSSAFKVIPSLVAIVSQAASSAKIFLWRPMIGSRMNWQKPRFESSTSTFVHVFFLALKKLS